MLAVVAFGSHHWRTDLWSASPFKRSSQIPALKGVHGWADGELMGSSGGGSGGGVVNSFCSKGILSSVERIIRPRLIVRV